MTVWQAGDVADTRPARRLAGTIGTIRTVLLGLVGLGVLLVSFTAGYPVGVRAAVPVLIGVWIYGVISAATIYVLFGWLEHTLRLLIGIAHNTADGPGAFEVDD
jgi:hypothetical protein